MRGYGKRNLLGGSIAVLLALGVPFAPRLGWTHCDTLDGPVVAAARLASSAAT